MARYRDAICFLLGSSGFLHELIVAQIERPFILTASLALMGFPFVLAAESKLRNGKNGRNNKNGGEQ